MSNIRKPEKQFVSNNVKPGADANLTQEKKQKPALSGLIMMLLFLLLPLLAGGCWSKAEVEDISIVLAIGIEEPEQSTAETETEAAAEVEMVVQQLVPKNLQQGGAKPAYINLVEQGTTLSSINNRMNQFAPRELFYAHNKLVLIDEKYAREQGISDIIDYFNRGSEFHRNTWVMFTKGATPLEILNCESELEDIPAQTIADLADSADISTGAALCSLCDFLQYYGTKGTEAYGAGVVLQKGHNYLTGTEAYGEAKKNILLSNTAVFRGEYLQGWLNVSESRGLLWVRDEVKQGIINVRYGTSQELAAIEIMRSKCQITPEWKNNKAVFKIKISMVGRLTEETGTKNLAVPEEMEQLRTDCAQQIKSEINAALAKARDEYHADVFGLGDRFYRALPQKWATIEDEWTERYFPDCQVMLEVDVKLKNTGQITSPARPDSEQVNN